MRHLLPLYEYTKKDLTKPLKSFDLKGKLNPKVWQKEKVKVAIRKKLIAIADDFWAGMNLDLDYADIYFTGSLANFNWSSYSDFDLHLVVDFKKVNKDTSLVQKYFNEVKANWNGKHDITIMGFDVELYVQDSAANAEDGTFISTGVYSLTNDKWVAKPQGFDEEVDKKGLEARAKLYMTEIDELEADLDKADYHVFKERLDRAWDKIIKGRKAGLMKDGELSLENLVFKLMRRNGYIEKIIDMKGLSYDRHLSIK